MKSALKWGAIIVVLWLAWHWVSGMVSGVFSRSQDTYSQFPPPYPTGVVLMGPQMVYPRRSRNRDWQRYRPMGR